MDALQDSLKIIAWPVVIGFLLQCLVSTTTLGIGIWSVILANRKKDYRTILLIQAAIALLLGLLGIIKCCTDLCVIASSASAFPGGVFPA